MATERIQTACTMCVSRCGVIATVTDGRFEKLEYDPAHPNGCICVKGAAAPDIIYSDDRLRHPMVRTRPKGDPDPGWVPISWDEAMAMAAEKLSAIRDRDGAEAVVFSRATPAASAIVDLDAWVARLANAFGSPNILTTGHICLWSRLRGAKYTYGVPIPPPDFENAACLMLWGANPQTCDPAMAKRISRARRRGMKMIVVDPRGHDLARKADYWLRVRPGSDGALALAMIHVLFEDGLIDVEFLRDWTNAPFLVRSDTGQLLRGDAVAPPGDAVAWAVWDQTRGGPAAWDRQDGFAEDGVRPELFGRFSVRLADGSTLACRTALEELKRLAAEYAPERSEAITWVAAADVRRAARLFAEQTPSAYFSWTGTELHSAAGQMNRAIACLYTLTGQFDTSGSNLLMPPTPTRPVTGEELLDPGQREKRLGLADHPIGPPSDPGHIQARPLCDAILEGRPYPVRALIAFGGDLLMSHGDPARSAEALRSLEFLVQIDMVANASAPYADLLLPAATLWECENVRPFVLGSPESMKFAQLRRAVIPPRHDSRPDMDILFDLACRLDHGEEFFGGDVETALNHLLEPSGLTVAELRASPGGIAGEVRVPERKYALTNPDTGKPRGFATPTGRIELYATRYADAGYAPLPEYTEPVESSIETPDPEFPLVLTTFRTVNFCQQQHRGIARLRRMTPDPTVLIHPDTAQAANIAEGDWLGVETRHGGARFRAAFDDTLHPGVVSTHYGWWQECRELNLPGYDPLSEGGANANLLIANTDIDPISASVPHRSRMCRVVPVGAS